MKVILDTNILISALIRNSITRKIIFTSYLDFYYPKQSIEEVYRHKNLILKKSGMTSKNFDELFSSLLEVIHLVSEEIVEVGLDMAKKTGIEDSDDFVFLACAFEIAGSILWSDDKGFETQNSVKVMKTEEIIKLLKM